MTRLLMLAALAAPAAFASTTMEPVVVGASYTVSTAPGPQTDPHVSGDIVAYTDQGVTPSNIRYHHLSTSNDQAIPNGGGADQLSDISGTRIVFSRVVATGAKVMLYDVSTGTETELDPAPGVIRGYAAIGGDTVVWLEFGSGSSAINEVMVHDLTAGTTQAITSAGQTNWEPAVSPDGNTVTWTQCNFNGQACDVWVASRSGGSWITFAITGGEGEEASAATDGVWVAYESARSTGAGDERDIYYQPVGGGAEVRLPLAGAQGNPSVAGQLIAFESKPVGGNADILLYDTRTSILYQLTSSPADEILTDIDVDPATGVVRVVYMRDDGGDYNVYAFSFVVQEPPPTCEDPVDHGCDDPSARQLLAELVLARKAGHPQCDSDWFVAKDGEEGLICVENGDPTGKRATSGKVWLNGKLEVNAHAFKKSVARIEERVTLKDLNYLKATLAGAPGSSYTVRVYGGLTSCAAQAASTAASLRVKDVGGNELGTIRGHKLFGPGGVPAPQEDVAPLAGITGGCASTGGGGGLSLLALFSAAALLAGRRTLRRPVTVRARR